MPSRRLPLPAVVDLCRNLRHSLGAGLSLVQVLRQQSKRGRPEVQALAGRLTEALQAGQSLSAALDAEPDVFPPLFLALVRLGEETGHLPEIFRELEQYYQQEWQLRRQLLSQSLLPALQLGFAVFLIAGLIWLLHALSGQALLTVFGLAGAPGAFAFLVLVAAALGSVWVVYRTLTRVTRQQAAGERVLLRVPVVGPCLQTLALSRFTLALTLTLDAGLMITRALRLSLKATGFASYAERGDVVVRELKNGRTLYEALAASELFGPEFLELVATGEEGGRVPEMMRHQAAYYREEASRKLTTLTRVASGAVWVVYAGFMIWMIFRIAGVYFNALKL